jgi:hypothetical protein
VRAARLLVFLGTVAAFYYALGMAVALGADTFLPPIDRVLDTGPATAAIKQLGERAGSRR